MTTPIPSPPTVPFLGYAASIDKEVPLNSFNLLAKQYGEIYELNMFGEAIDTLTGRIYSLTEISRTKAHHY